MIDVATALAQGMALAAALDAVFIACCFARKILLSLAQTSSD